MTGATAVLRRPRRRRLDVAVLACATVLGLWFGLGAPSVSPVAPTASTITTVTVTQHHHADDHGDHR